MEKKNFSIITKPGVTVFFTWIALSAAIFFGAYSVKILGKYEEKVAELDKVMSSERELSYRLELAAIKIKESADVIEWNNVEITRLRTRNEDVLEKSANLRKLLYTAVKKNQTAGAETLAEKPDDQISSVVPKSSKSEEEPKEFSLTQEVIFPELSSDNMNDTSLIEGLVRSSEELSQGSREVVAEVLTYNSASRKVFISLGRSNNADIREGSRFAIWRNGKHVTDIRVAQVHAVTSTCEIISPLMDNVRSGDTAELIRVSAY